MVAFFGMVVDRSTEIFQVSLGSPTLAFVRSALTFSGCHIFAAELSSDVIESFNIEKLDEPNCSFSGFFRSCLFRNAIFQIYFYYTRFTS
jgi:hypothetical protein